MVALSKVALFCLASADKPNAKTDALAAKGPAAIGAALEDEAVDADVYGDEKHEASIAKHWKDYLSERKERINDAKGGQIPTRQRDAVHDGPAAVEAAIKSELPEAEKYGDTEHIASLKKHLADYEAERAERIMDKNQASRMNGRQGAAYKYDFEHKTTAATDAALESVLREALKYHDVEHIKSILAHKAHYDAKAYGGRQNPWDYTYDEEAPALEHAAYEHRITEVNDPGGNDGHITKEQAYSEARKEHQYTTYARAECHLPLPTSNDLHHAAGCRSGFSYGQWSTVYNALSFGIASMGSAMLFVWLMIYNTHKKFRPALGINGLVTGIATYHYFRIFNSWNEAFDVFFDGALGRFVVNSSGQPFNDAYRYVDWLLTVPLLLVELIMVMQLPEGEAGRKMWSLGVFSGLMVANGYPGEIQDDPAGRWFYWTLSMIPFTYVLYELYFGLAEATKKHAPSVAALIASARYLTAISWLTYPFVYMVKGVGLGGSDATMAEQVGYSIADVTAKAVFGIVIWRIANEKTILLEEQSLLK